MKPLSNVIRTAIFTVTALGLSISPEIQSRESDGKDTSLASPGFYLQFERCHACSYQDWQRDTAMALKTSGVHAYVSDVITSHTVSSRYATVKELHFRKVGTEGWPLPVFAGPFGSEDRASQFLAKLPSILKPTLDKFLRLNADTEKALGPSRQLENCSGNHCSLGGYTVNLVRVVSTENGKEMQAAKSGGQNIPRNFHGAWDAMEGKVNRCKYGTDSDSRFTVTSSAVTYYESRCQLRRVDTSQRNTFRGLFDCEGEGQRWAQEISLTLDGGKLVHKGLGTGISHNNRCR